MPITQMLRAAQALIRKYYVKVETPQRNFLEVLAEHLKDREIKRQWSGETIRKYRFCQDKVSRFFKLKKLDQLPIDQLKVPMFEEFRRWMHDPSVSKSCGLTHSSRHLEMCIAAMDYAVREGHIKFNPIASLETGRDKRKSVVNLTSEELLKWIRYDFQNVSFRRVQLLSIFQAATGLSYGNLFDYQTRLDQDTGLWIEDERKKVGHKPFFVPLDAPEFEIARAIHDEFDGKLPRIDNGTYNRMLKEMAAVLNIDKKLSTHNFRKTFATLMDQDGFALGVIAAILGNSEEICRDHYINQSKKKVAKAFQERNDTNIIRSSLLN